MSFTHALPVKESLNADLYEAEQAHNSSSIAKRGTRISSFANKNRLRYRRGGYFDFTQHQYPVIANMETLASSTKNAIRTAIVITNCARDKSPDKQLKSTLQ